MCDHHLMNNHDAYAIALYYCYVPLDDKVPIVMEFHAPFRSLLGGRVRVSQEGLNGVLSGKRTDLAVYSANLSALLSSYFEATLGSPTTTTPTTTASFELDVKYCDLRPELPVAVQLFTTYIVQETSHVVQLVDDTVVPPRSRTNTTKISKKKKKQQQQQQHESPLSQPLYRATSLDVYQESLAVKNATVEHLSPDDWNERLLVYCTSSASSNNINKNGQQQQQKRNIVIVDCRNSYESDIGHFVVPGGFATTLLTNTRKFSELPQVFEDTIETLQAADEIYMYCTGGVRCERASGYLQTLLLRSSNVDDNSNNTQMKKTTKVYQLHGGIQRYLERERPGGSLYRGKNFVFDPRRVDPHGGIGVIGQCLVCNTPHDDYDNGRPSCEDHPARCCKCRVLMLVCEECRTKVSCWGDDNADDEDCTALPKLYCGGSACWHRPPPRVIVEQEG
jgi:predicted sulfurtransferase